MDTIRRQYRMTDSVMLQASKTMHGHFVNEQAQFAAFDPDLGPPFEDEWQQAIGQCANLLDDETVRDRLQQHTADVKTAMRACHNKFMDTKYFIRRAFPENMGIWQAFGFDTFLVKARRQLILIEFMQVFHTRAVEHAAALNAVGYDNAAIAEINTLYDTLEQRNTEQESFKGARGTATEERKLAHNRLWQIMRTVNSASRAIYRNSFAKSRMFLLPVAVRKKKKVTETEAEAGGQLEG